MVEIFQVVGSFGIQGGLRVSLYTDDLFSYKKVYNETGKVFSFSAKRRGPSEYIVFIDGITDRSAADSLRGKIFYVSRADLKQLSKDQFYIYDLIGEKVQIEGLNASCNIVAVQNYGAGDLLELSYNGKTFLVPFTKRNFPDVLSGPKFIISLQAFKDFINVAG